VNRWGNLKQAICDPRVYFINPSPAMMHPCMLEHRRLSYHAILPGQYSVATSVPFPGSPLYKLLTPLEDLMIFRWGTCDGKVLLQNFGKRVDRVNVFRFRVVEIVFMEVSKREGLDIVWTFL